MNDTRKSNTVLAVERDENGKLVFASDRRVSWGFHRAQRLGHAKTIKRDGYIMAGTGECSVIEEVLMGMKLPKAPKGELALHKFMLFNFAKAVINHFAKAKFIEPGRRGFSPRDNKSADTGNLRAIIMIGVNSQVFELDLGSEISVGSVQTPYALGCGGMYAWGALLATQDLDMTVEERLRRAIVAAGTVSPGCDTEVDIVRE